MTGIVLIFSGILYFLLGTIILKGWKKNQGLNGTPGSKKISVVIAARNEAANIGNLLKDLSHQIPETSIHEIILANDQSSDQTSEVASRVALENKLPLKIIEVTGPSSKKQALKEAIDAASGNWILVTDADCRVPSTWVAGMREKIGEVETGFISGPVKMLPGQGFFSDFQSLDFMAISGSGAGLLGAGVPLYCNGANMAFSRETFLKLGGYEGSAHIASGDDVFLLRKFIQAGATIRFIKDAKVMVSTKPENTVKEFFLQRLRWASKNNQKPDFKTFLTGTVIILPSFLIWFWIAGIYFKGWNLLPMLLLVALKFISDWRLLQNFSHFYGYQNLLLIFLPSQILVIVYQPLIVVCSWFVPQSWKGRKIR